MTTAAERTALIAKLRALPARLEALIAPLTDAQLSALPSGAWSAKQNVHHLADSHMNAFIRVKLALLEDQPTLKPYNQDDWADTPDAQNLPVESSLAILRGLHMRWAALFESLSEAQFVREAFHPENGMMRVITFLEYYAAHGEAHLEQIREALEATNTPVTWTY
ncbi:MAG: metal-dependent hydrolase [Chloroflexi bacterium CFX4]|nr:metal-dependent hydrolase [Chloroflexi bacterium CFX4]MDL1921253.1 metal-dependent hydrolase [Chloroflexi bacterium CFX3]